MPLLPSVSARRRIAALCLTLAVLPPLAVRDRGSVPDHAAPIRISPLAVPVAAHAGLGPLRLSGAWVMRSTNALWGGWSALAVRRDGTLLAISDGGARLAFAPPASDAAMELPAARLERITRDPDDWTGITDAEAAILGPSGEVWIAWEDRRAISRFSPDFARELRAFPAQLRGYSSQFGVEAMVRLADGRFLLQSEGSQPRSYGGTAQTLVYASDPAEGPAGEPRRLRLELPRGYQTTDMALMPDGRVLVLLRRLVRPLPLRFSGLLAIADPAQLDRTGRWHASVIARLEPPLPTDNFEGLAVNPRKDGLLDLWMISDDNNASTQRTLLYRFTLDPGALPRKR